MNFFRLILFLIIVASITFIVFIIVNRSEFEINHPEPIKHYSFKLDNEANPIPPETKDKFEKFLDNKFDEFLANKKKNDVDTSALLKRMEDIVNEYIKEQTDRDEDLKQSLDDIPKMQYYE